MQGYFLEDLQIGQSATYSRTVSEQDVQKFGEVSGDMNPLHFDEDYAKTTLFHGRIAHGMLSASYISAVLGTKLPGPGSIFMTATIRFRAPVRIGDTVDTVVSVREIVTEKKRVIFDCQCKVKDTVVIEAEALIMVPSKKPKAV
jgi:3-hydroxybutyryl-CoA dehydratase